MKKISFLLIVSFFMTSICLKAQDNKIKPDSRLYECFEASYVNQMEQSNPKLVAYYNYYLENSFYVVDLKQSKPVTGENINSVTLIKDLSKDKTIYFSEKSFDLKKFNVLKYKFKTEDNSFSTYIWKDAGIAIIFLPRNQIAEGYQKFIKDNKI
ncbi:MAG: hypothetical protein HXX09_15990 [Bacteroidetes bacterium]|nr:hypothetical protein [Bacteroidota bacterium]